MESAKFAATTDDAMDSLLFAFDQIYQDFKNGISENQTLRVNCTAEVKKREALEFIIHSLQSENERLTRLYKESIQKLADEIELHTSFQRLKEELKRVNDKHLQKEKEHSNAMELLKQDHAKRTEELESQIRLVNNFKCKICLMDFFSGLRFLLPLKLEDIRFRR